VCGAEVTIHDRRVGRRAARRAVITQDMIDEYAAMTGDFSPIHVDPEYAAGARFGVSLSHGMLTASFVQAPVTELVAPGGVSVEYHLRLVRPVPAGSEVEAEAECVAVDVGRGRATLHIGVRLVGGAEVMRGEAEIAFPRRHETG